jgi:hypothetical protein
MCQGVAEELSNRSEHCQVRKVASLLAQALILTVAVMFADGPLVLLVRHHVGVREVRRALHGFLVHP